MKKIKLIITMIAVFGGIAAVLMYNKSKIEARTKSNEIEAYAVTLSEVRKDVINKSLEMIGTITGDNDVAIVSEASGRVVKVNAKVGDYKPAGSVLFQLDDELKYAAFKTAEVSYEKAKKDFERFEILKKEKSITDTQYENARLAYQSAEAQYIAAKRQYSDTKITTPIAGVVTAKNVDIGNFVNTGAVVANVVNISKLKVKVNVAEKDVFKLKAGDKVEITTDVYPGIKFEGKIETISSKGDEAHTYPVEVTLMNSQKNPLKAGMFGRVSFISAANKERLLIPREALVGSIKDPKVFTVDNQTARLKEITIGAAFDNYLEVLSGLNEGEKIVTNGQNNLKDNNPVIISNEGDF